MKDYDNNVFACKSKRREVGALKEGDPTHPPVYTHVVCTPLIIYPITIYLKHRFSSNMCIVTGGCVYSNLVGVHTYYMLDLRFVASMLRFMNTCLY